MDCLIDYVGIQGCGASSPASGFFLNSLPGISIKSIEALADSEKKTYLAVWENIQTRCAKRMQAEVHAAFAKRYKLKSVTQNINTGRLIDATVTEAAAPDYRGILLNLDKWYDNTEYEASSLQSHYLQAVYFYASGNQNGSTVKVFDYDLDTEIDSFTFDAVTGWNTIPVHTLYGERRIVVAVDSTAFTSASLTLPDSLTLCYDCGSYAQGAKWAIADNPSDAELGDNTYGLSVLYGVRCKFDGVVCNNLEAFLMPWAYLLGSELMMERLASDVISKWTVDRKQAEELKAYYDSEFNRVLAQVVEGITLSKYDCCLECDPPLAVRESNFH